MKKLRILLGAIVALVAAAVIIPMFIPADTYKALLIEQVKKSTGRDLVIAGDAKLKLLPNVSLNVSDVSLSNPQGFMDEQLAKIGKLSVGVALRPLLNKQLVMQGLTLENADIAMEEKADGSKSWSFGDAKSPAMQTTSNNAKKSTLSDVVLGNIHIKDSSFTWRKAGEKPLMLERVNLDMDSSGFSAPLSVDASAVYNGEKVSASFTAENMQSFMQGQATPTNLRIMLPHTQVSFSGKAAHVSPVDAKGDLVVTVSNLPKLKEWLTGAWVSASTPKEIKVNGQLGIEGKTLRLANAMFGMDALAASGNLKLSMAKAIPSLAGDLSLGDLDINPVIAKTADEGGEGTSKATIDGWSNSPIDLSSLRKANANLAIKATSIKTGSLTLGSTSLSVVLTDGALHINDIATSLYGGTAKGNVSLNDAGVLSAAMKISAVQIEDLMKALSGKSRIAGTATLNFNLNASGKSQRAWVNTLGGNGDMFVRDGAILGVNIGKFLRDAKQGFLFSGNTSERTDFAELIASFTSQSGVISNSDLSMKAPLLRLTGKGTVSLPPKTLNYTLTPKISATGAGQGGKDDKVGVAIPLLISGPWSNPSITPNVAGALEEGLKDPQAIKDNIKEVKDKIGDLNSKDDIKKAVGGELLKGLGIGGEGKEGGVGNILKF